LTYSIVKIPLNGGQGGINDNEKNIELGFYITQNCQLICTGHATENAYWLVAAYSIPYGFIDGITVVTFEINSNGVTENFNFTNPYEDSYTYGPLDDMRVSPDCGKIGLVYKAHFIVLMRLNNETGEIFDAFPQALDLENSFITEDYIEFSPSSEYLWSLSDNSGVSRFSLDVWDPNSMYDSQEIMLPGFWFGGDYSDIRLGPDGHLYLNKENDNAMDRISNPDEPLTSLFIEPDVLVTQSGFTNRFPNLPNLSCLPPSLTHSILHEFECIGDATQFTFFSTFVPDSLLWNFGDPASGVLNSSQDEEPFHIFSTTGTFTVTLTLWLNGEAQEATKNVIIFQTPEFELGPDQEICQGESITLDTQLSGFAHEWNTGASTTFIDVTTNGEYTVEVRNGSCLRSDTVNVAIVPQLFLSLTEPPAECEDDPVQLNGVIDFSDGFFWNNGETTPSITVTESGTYTLSAFNSCFSDSVSATVTYANLPENLLGNDRLECSTDSLMINALFLDGNYLWSTGQSGPSIYITESGTYSVTLNYLGCVRFDEVEIELVDYVPLNDIVMPNVFTPNGDSENASFRPFLPENPNQDLCELAMLDVDLSVYNRWGGMLTKEGDCEWRGTFNSDALPEGTYYYILTLRSACSEKIGERRIDGHFSLLRD